MEFRFGFRGIMPLMLSAALLTTFVSCGGMYDDDDDSSGGPSAEEQVDSGTFRAVLAPENPTVSTAAGTAEITITGDDLEASVIVTSARAGTHAQHVHTGTRCPTIADDTNGDGVVDAQEATAVYGPPMLNLDSELESANVDRFPSGISYNYDEDGSLAQILSSLNVATLGLEGKVVNIHGVPESTDLPATVQGGKAAFPITCGVLQRVSDGGSTTGTTTGTTTGETGATAATTTGEASATTGDTTGAAAASAAAASAAAAASTSASAATTTGTVY